MKLAWRQWVAAWKTDFLYCVVCPLVGCGLLLGGYSGYMYIDDLANTIAKARAVAQSKAEWDDLANDIREADGGTVSRPARTPSLFACPVPTFDQPDKVIGGGFDLVTGVSWRTFDLNGDTRPDYHIEYDLRGRRDDHTIVMPAFPHLYYLDTNGDGGYDRVLVDTQGNGRCEDLAPYTERAR